MKADRDLTTWPILVPPSGEAIISIVIVIFITLTLLIIVVVVVVVVVVVIRNNNNTTNNRSSSSSSNNDSNSKDFPPHDCSRRAPLLTSESVRTGSAQYPRAVRGRCLCGPPHRQSLDYVYTARLDNWRQIVYTARFQTRYTVWGSHRQNLNHRED